MAKVATLLCTGTAKVNTAPAAPEDVVRKFDLDARSFIAPAGRPTSFTSDGKAGQWTADRRYVYFCYADNLWGYLPLISIGTFPVDQPTLP